MWKSEAGILQLQMVARCKEDIIKAKGVKPTLSPNLNTLATVEALDVKKLLFIGVGCQVKPCNNHAYLTVHSLQPLSHKALIWTTDATTNTHPTHSFFGNGV